MKKQKDIYDEMAEILLKEGKLETSKDINDLFNKLKGRIYQGILEGELTHHLEYEKNSKCDKDTENRRNGYSSIDKKVRIPGGEITISMPRDRNGSFEPVILKKRQRVLDEMNNNIILLYSKGMSQRDIVEIIKETYQIEVSMEFISDIIKSVNEEVEKWQNRPLKEIYPFVYVDCLYVSIKDEMNISKKKAVYVILGIDITGKKEVLSIYIGEEESEAAYFWNRIFSDIKARGVKDILYVSMDGLTGLKEAIENEFPKTNTQRCIVHLARNLYKKCNKKEAKEILQDFKKIYTSPTEPSALLELENFKQKYHNNEKIVKTVEDYMPLILPLFEVPMEIRKIIYTTNPIESLNSALRKVTKGKGSFPNEQALLKILYLRVRDLQKKWSKGIQNWNVVLNQLVCLYEDRLKPYLV